MTTLVQAGTDSPQNLYDAVEKFIHHRVFRAHCKNPSEPRNWLGVAAFLGLTQETAEKLNEKIRGIEDTIKRTLEWLDKESRESIRRGPVGGDKAISRFDVEKLQTFLGVIQDRLSVQIAAIRKRP
jgi:hypothetical protein